MTIAQSMTEKSLISAYPQASGFVFDDAAHRALAWYPGAGLMCLAILAVEPEESVIVSPNPQATFRIFECADDIVVGQSAAIVFAVAGYLVVADAVQTTGYCTGPQLVVAVNEERINKSLVQ